MVNVVALQRGYFGGEIREPGDVFEIDDERMKDGKNRPSWVRLAAFGGKGDHDGDGVTGGAVPADDDKAKPKRGRKAKPETVDAPEPVRVKNEINEALGTAEPDWIAPSEKSDEI